ncbi:unnamed protein product [Didymodactylos carnosus]|uniref:Uncharacterized protein n=1 Tax=Didymodactylos carnosus TaxID=1234261 RepID=A0A814X906_9BILA|nr:unnamed protein product [Didymodactylos carnosus]CAF1212944.1 unnamed protein product [Didymodactylos carnosus]CAF3976831.1 unnamed protein product [Didymodactylos carnosus]CAF3995623.1 unnamed protein product [Didymodactylos carnosus]
MWYCSDSLAGCSSFIGGCQAEYVRVPFADVNTLKISTDIEDEKVLFLSDIVCSSWHATAVGNVEDGKTVAVWGCGGPDICIVAIDFQFVKGRSDALKRAVQLETDIPEILREALENGADAYKLLDENPNHVIKLLLKTNRAQWLSSSTRLSAVNALYHKIVYENLIGESADTFKCKLCAANTKAY